eukprot:1534304-Alexandrium_andersonii.AAC.1
MARAARHHATTVASSSMSAARSGASACNWTLRGRMQALHLPARPLARSGRHCRLPAPTAARRTTTTTTTLCTT